MSILQFGTAVRDITPSRPIWLAGYGNRYHKSTGVLEPLSIGCIALKTDNKTILIITCDLLGINDNFCKELYQLINEKTGVGFPDILISCSHTHFAGITGRYKIGAPEASSPDYTAPTPVEQTEYAKLENVGFVPPDSAFIADIKTKILEIAEESIGSLRPGTIDTAKVNVEQIAYNRRTRTPDDKVVTNVLYPEDPENFSFRPFDPELTIMRLSTEEGIQAVLVNYGCHPVTGGTDSVADHYMISSDYPFYVRQIIEQEYHCPVFFTLGAAGDTVPINRFGNSRKQIGNIIGNSVLMAERIYQPVKLQEINTDAIELEVETIVRTSDSAEEDYNQARQKIVELLQNTDNDLGSSEYNKAYNEFNKTAHLAERHSLYPDNRHTVKIQFCKIGDLVIIGIPFEVMSEISLKIKEQFPTCFIVSIGGGYQGYLPLEHEFSRGGYEADESSSHFKEDTADRMVVAITEKLKTFG